MSKVWRRGLPFTAEVAPFVRHMPLVEEHREGLVRLQGAWDSLALLGQMSGAATDMAHTRSAFQALTGSLLDSLARRQLDNAVQRLQGKAQVAIDILVRNLFERTADVGFLAADAPLRALVAGADLAADARPALEARFRAYVAKYSVYDDIVVLSPQGLVLARLDRSVALTHSADPLIAEALRPGTPFVERFGTTELLGGRAGLIYASAVRAADGTAGVLCLSFRLVDEMAGVFRQLLAPADRTVIVLLDAEFRVLVSSDPWQLPPGAQLPPARQHRLVFAGRDYLAVAAPASGYEGYRGPGWSALALLPVEQAFVDDEAAPAGPDHGFEQLAASVDTRELFDAELRGIPLEARRIQRDLSRSLWNGKLRSRLNRSGAGGTDFAVTLLNEVERTGQQLRQVFEQAIGNLHHSALAAVFDAAQFHARLAIDIMDRNLYERANDCRWWALDGELQQALAGGSAEAASARLRHINSLYTVYALLLVFDAQGRIVAVSDPAHAHRVGERLEQPWVTETLALRDRERFVVSPHQACGLYGESGETPTYVYAAALPAPDDETRVLGGVAIVFDGAPQFAAMLRDALPQEGQGSALLLSRDGRVVASSDARWAAGAVGPLAPALLDLGAGDTQRCELTLDGVVHAVGIAMSGGYREYRQGVARSDRDVAAVMLVPLGRRLIVAATAPLAFVPPPLPPSTEGTLDIASFMVDGQWLGLPAEQTLEALERPRITGMPNTPAALIGMLSHHEQMLPVLDLGLLRGGRPSADADAPVLVCQDGRGQRLALRVQELGPVFSIAPAAAQPSPALGGLVAAGRERLVRGGGDAAAMLTLIDIDELRRRLSAGAGEALDLIGA
ncbi:chemotaxis protein CheW [Roseateles toxinivorans]|uniref:Chemotaxis signal transduction protein n=1 Tax=Roseateles toxinivorans TaxID=270368 RepID=A0A4R6QQL7_9BURK|nr:chemotaxis protein CheW [Roseateles toxinivorans]TDP71554.1 chemotaxis signal transduction protein [Roseateles toxinivorans]